MEARTHDTFAFAALMTAAVAFPPIELNALTLVSAVVGNVVGARIPDIDQAGNKLWDFLPAGNTVGKVFSHVFYKHRTITHSLIGTLLIYKLLEWILPKVFNTTYINPHIVLFGVMIGYISHLVADSFTKEGLPLLFPLKWTFGFPPVKALRITTGSWLENFIVLPLIGVYVIWFAVAHQSQLVSILHLIH